MKTISVPMPFNQHVISAYMTAVHGNNLVVIRKKSKQSGNWTGTQSSARVSGDSIHAQCSLRDKERVAVSIVQCTEWSVISNQHIDPPTHLP